MKLFIFGSTGDLVRKKVMPALHSLDRQELEIWAIGRRDFEREIYHDFACGNNCRDSFKQRLHYLQVDFESGNVCAKCLTALDKDEINYFYLATPPKLYKGLLSSLARLKSQGYKIRVLLEKPFGESLQEARELKELIFASEMEDKVLIADHYLFKEGIKGLCKTEFKQLDIIATEEVGLEGRVSFYEGIGALKDMVQSHLLNILFKLMPSLKKPGEIVVEDYSRGQCGDGICEGYAGALGKPSATETFAHLRLRIGESRVTITTGKGLSQKKNELAIDGKIVDVKDEGAYERLFEAFFSGKRREFPSIERSILAWEIVEKALAREAQLFYYPRGSSLKSIEPKLKP